jgi:hypothetical protein
MSPGIERFFMQLPDALRPVAMELREVVLQADAGLAEDIKWGQLTFSKAKKNIAFIYTYPGSGYINLGFFKATLLHDPKRMFEGTGKLMRHIKLYADGSIPSEQIQEWIKEAAALGA